MNSHSNERVWPRVKRAVIGPLTLPQSITKSIGASPPNLGAAHLLRSSHPYSRVAHRKFNMQIHQANKRLKSRQRIWIGKDLHCVKKRDTSKGKWILANHFLCHLPWCGGAFVCVWVCVCACVSVRVCLCVSKCARETEWDVVEWYKRVQWGRPGERRWWLQAVVKQEEEMLRCWGGHGGGFQRYFRRCSFWLYRTLGSFLQLFVFQAVTSKGKKTSKYFLNTLNQTKKKKRYIIYVYRLRIYV